MKTMIELQTPLLSDVKEYVAGLARLDNFGTVILEENGGISATTVAGMLKECSDKEIFLKVSCRDRNRIALHSELLTAAAHDLLSLVIIDGVHPVHTLFPAAKPVYELDSLSLLRMMKQDSPCFGDESISPLSSLPWTIGACIGGDTSADKIRAKKFLAAGADLFFVQSFDTLSWIRSLSDKPVILSVPEEKTADLSVLLREAESSGANGVNLKVTTLEKVLDGSIVGR